MLAGKAAGHCRRGGQKADLELAMMCSSKGRALDGGEHAAGPAGPEPGGPGDASCFPCPRALPCQLDATRGAAQPPGRGSSPRLQERKSTRLTQVNKGEHIFRHKIEK